METIRELKQELRNTISEENLPFIQRDLADAYFKIEDYEKAIKHYDEAFSLFHRNPKQQMLCLGFMAECYRRQSMIRMSIKYNLRHLKLAKRYDNKLEYQRACCNLGNALLDESETYLENKHDEKFLKFHDKSLKYLKEAEVSARKLVKLSKRNPSNFNNPHQKKEDQLFDVLSTKDYETLVIEAVLNKANAYHVKGRYDKKYYKDAQDHLQKVIEMAIQSKKPILEGKAYFALGSIYLTLKEFETSLYYFEKDARICEMNRDYHGLSKTLRELGKLHLMRRDYDRSKELYRKALQTMLQHFPKNTLEAQEIEEELDNLKLEVQYSKNLDDILKKTAKMEENQKELRDDWFVKILEALEIALDKIEYPEKSAKIARSAIDLINQNRVRGVSKLGDYIAKLYSYLAYSLHKLEKYDEAKQAYLQTLELYKKKYEKEKCEEYPVTLIDYGNMLDESTQDFEEVQRIYDEAFKYAKECNNQRVQLIALTNLELLYRGKNKKKELQEIKALIAKLDSKQSQDSDSSFEMGSDVEFDDSDSDEPEERMVVEEPVIKSSRDRKKVRILEDEDMEITTRKPNDDRQMILESLSERRKKSNTPSGTVSAQKPQPVTSQKPQQVTSQKHPERQPERQPEPVFFANEIVNLTPQQQMQNLFEKLCKKHIVPSNAKFFGKITSKELNLKNSSLQEDAVRIALKVATLNRELKVINLEGNRLGARGMKTLINLITNKRPELRKSLTTLSLSKNPIRMGNVASEKTNFSALLAALPALSSLEQLDLSYIPFSQSEKGVLFETLGKLKNLKILKLKGCNLDSFEVKALNRSLQKLKLSCNQLNQQTFKDIFLSGSLESVAVLDLSSQRYPSNQESYYQGASNDMDIEKSAEESMSGRFPKIFCLKMRNLDFDSLASVVREERFSEMIAALKVLDLSGSTSTKAFFESSSNYFYTNKFSGIRVVMNIQKFKYQKGDFTDDETATELKKFLVSLQNVEKIDLSYSRFNDELCEKLPDDLVMFNSSLRKLDVRGVQLKYNFQSRIRSNIPGIVLKED